MLLQRLLASRLRRLHVCPYCGSDFVSPVRWHEANETHWWVRLRCGQCERWHEGLFTDKALERFERKLDNTSRRLANEADRLHREWRSTEADAFAAALDRGLIDAGDFV
jgi:hypothetical protein